MRFSAAAIFLALGILSRPLIQSKLLNRGRSSMPTVLASSQAPKSQNSAAGPSVDTATLDELRAMAEKGDAAAQNSLGLRYFNGDETNGIRQDEAQAFQWFVKAADQGNIAAQSKLGAMYWAGRGVQVSYPEAYFWSILARANGDEASKDRAAILSSRLTRAQIVTLEDQADRWFQRRQLQLKPDAAR